MGRPEAAAALVKGEDSIYAYIRSSKLEQLDLSNSTFYLNKVYTGYATEQESAHDLPSPEVQVISFSHANIVDSSFQDCDLSNAGFAYTEMDRCTFEKSSLNGAKFLSPLPNVSFKKCDLKGASFTRVDMSNGAFEACDMSQARFFRSSFTKVYFSAEMCGIEFECCEFNNCHFRRGINLSKSYFLQCEGLDTCTGLTDYVAPGGLVEIVDPLVKNSSRHDWEYLRKFGRLPLLGASYTALLMTPPLGNFLAYYNNKVAMLQEWAADQHNVPALAPVRRVIQSYMQPLSLPPMFFWLFFGAVLLAVASTIFHFACPSRIKEFSQDQWCDQLKNERLQYMALSWKQPIIRTVCFWLYVSGSALVLSILLIKLITAAIRIVQYGGLRLWSPPPALTS